MGTPHTVNLGFKFRKDVGKLYTDTVAFACPLRENVLKGISIVEVLRNLMAYDGRLSEELREGLCTPTRGVLYMPYPWT